MSFNIHIDVNDEGDGVLTSTHLDVIREYFSAENTKRNFVKGGKKFMPAREYAIAKDGTFNIGLLNEIFDYAKTLCGFLNADNFQVTARAKYYYEPSFLMPEKYDLHQFEGWDYRDIQVTALKNIFRRGRGIIEVGTAGGKGLVIASIIQTLTDYNPTTTFAIIVPTHLVDKTLVEFVDDYGFEKDVDISAWSGHKTHKLRPETRVIIAGQSIISSREEDFINHIANRSVVMVDECHIVKRDGVLNKRMKLVKTNNIIGLTGSLPENTMDRLNVLGVIGKVVCKIESRVIKDKGLKADSRIISIGATGCKDVKRTKDGYRVMEERFEDAKKAFMAEKEYLLRNKGRNAFITKLVERVCNKGNVLIPVDLDFHEKIVVDSLKPLGRKLFVINGNTPKEERTRIYKDMENEQDAILVAKVGVMREGISINNLSYMVGYFIQKSFIRIVQLIGRIERLGGIERPEFYDIWDDTTFSKKHYEKRKNIYAKERINLTEKSVKIDYDQGLIKEENE